MMGSRGLQGGLEYDMLTGFRWFFADASGKGQGGEAQLLETDPKRSPASMPIRFRCVLPGGCCWRAVDMLMFQPTGAGQIISGKFAHGVPEVARDRLLGETLASCRLGPQAFGFSHVEPGGPL
jgi:hypothetical protein